MSRTWGLDLVRGSKPLSDDPFVTCHCVFSVVILELQSLARAKVCPRSRDSKASCHGTHALLTNTHPGDEISRWPLSCS